MLHGKNAIVTGSTSGIGLGIAGALAQAGANVMMNGFGDAKEIEAERRRLENEHTRPAPQRTAVTATAAYWGANPPNVIHNALCPPNPPCFSQANSKTWANPRMNVASGLGLPSRCQ